MVSKPLLLMLAGLALTVISYWMIQFAKFGPYLFLLVFVVAVLTGSIGIRMALEVPDE